MFTQEELGRLSALGYYKSEALLETSPIDGVELFPIAYDPEIPAFEHVIPQSLVIGKRAEAFMEHYLQHDSSYEIIGDHVQIIDDGTTLGEMDFLLKERSSGTTLHMEMACKWYVFDPNADPEHQWAGPNKRDFLSHKIRKLKEQQFALLNDKRSEATLRELEIDPRSTLQALSIQGGVFVPFQFAGSLPLVRPETVIGTWCNLTDFLNREDQGNHHYVTEKKEWLIDPMYNREWHTRSDILNDLIRSLNEERSPMVWTIHPDGSVERTCIVWW